ncbi:MAG TPA: carboxypeptidase-like regulatory domain-containing protein [Solirubrobacterales bacterium]|jgi:hypothetical protein|nr:carboxypeptidase-like regulatory domain-containing protein [Solirubrobacterales bacterium]
MGNVRRACLVLALGALAPAIWASAAGAATIKGTVTDEAGNPIAGITVCAQAPEFMYPGNCAWGTDAEGHYAIEGLLEAGYHVGFYVESNPTLNYVPQWYGGKAHPEEGVLVAATGGVLEGIDAVMSPGGQIDGTVTDRATGLPVEGVEVCADLVGYFQDGEITYCRRTDASGGYDVKNLGTGSYRIEFRTDGGPNYVRENYGAEVAVIAGQTTAGIDAALAPGLQIEGDLTDAATGLPAESLLAPFSGLSICALDPVSEARVACIWPQQDGHYELAGLPPGEYVIAFALDRVEDGYAFPDGYVRRFWDEVQNFGEATPVGSATPGVISGIDAALSRGEEILPPGVPAWEPPFGASPSPSGGVGGPGTGASSLGAGSASAAAADVTAAAPRVAKAPPKAGAAARVKTCNKGFRHASKGRRGRCVKIHGKVKYDPDRRKTSHR